MLKVHTLSLSVIKLKITSVSQLPVMTINPLLNLSVVAVLYLSWLLYKQAIQVSTRAPGNRGAGIGFRTPDKISLRGPGSGHHRVAHEASIRRKGSQERTRPIRMPPARY